MTYDQTHYDLRGFFALPAETYILGDSRWRRSALLRICLAFLLCLYASLSGAQSTTSRLRTASAVAFNTAGDLYIADAAANKVFKATLAGDLVVVAGTGVQGYAGDGGPAVAAELNQPQGLAVGLDGTLYVADTGNQRVRAIPATGMIASVAGTGVADFGGDGGQATSAALRWPTALAVDLSGALLVCDSGNQRVRKIAARLITTIAGSGVQGFGGDGGPAASAAFDSPAGIAVAQDGRLFIADTHNDRIRVVDAAGVVATFAGMGRRGYGGDGGPATAALLSQPRGLVVDAGGSLLVADANNQRIRRIDTAGVITTLVGTGVEGASADGIASLSAALRTPRSVAMSSFGLPVLADTADAAVREVAAGDKLYQPAALAPGRTASVETSTASLTPVYGQGSVMASVLGSVGTPQGTMQANVDGRTMGSAPLQNGSAVLDLGSLDAGTHTLTLAYGGDGLNPATAGAALNVDVTAARVTAAAAPMTMTYGEVVPAMTGTLTGVLARDAGQVNAVYGVDGTDLAVGTYPITASLAGIKAHNYALSPGPGSGMLTVVKAGTGVTLSAISQAFEGLPISLSATVASSTRGQLTGSVQFLDGSTVVASAKLSGGVASALYASPPGGVRQISVQYLGDTNFLPSTSPSNTVAVSAIPDFVVTAGGVGSASVAAGAAATYLLRVSSRTGPFTGAVALSASGLPAGSTASFSPPQVVPGSNSAVVTLTVQTAAAEANMGPLGNAGRHGRILAFSLTGVFLLGFGGRMGKRRMLGALALAVLLTGCGARTVGEGIGGVLKQTYTVQVTGSATNLAGATVTHSLPLTLTVSQ